MDFDRSQTRVLLGIVDDSFEDQFELKEAWTVNKIGGSPAFPKLDQSFVSQFTLARLVCESCHHSLAFILQIYCPISDLHFERILYVFTCNNINCSDKQWIAVRCVSKLEKSENLKSKSEFNEWCSSRDEWQEDEDVETEEQIFASNDHHIPSAFWIKDECVSFFRPFYLNVEDEIDFMEEKKRLSNENNIEKAIESCENEHFVEEKYEKSENLIYGGEDAYKFFKKLSLCPQQVVRYNLWGEPLLSKSNVEVKVNACNCGAKRRFEFQLMPALINFMKPLKGVSTLDFGTVLIFCCENDCKTNSLNIESCFVVGD